MLRLAKRVVFLSLAFALLAAAVASYFGYWYMGRYFDTVYGGPERVFVVPKGKSVRWVAEELAYSGVVIGPRTLAFYARFTGMQFQAGAYMISPGMTVVNILHNMKSGKVAEFSLTVPEGFTSHQISALLRDAPYLEGEVAADIPEGLLMPDTYFYRYGEKRRDILARMQETQEATLEALWAERNPKIPLNREQAIILASLVERETGHPEERGEIAGVFYNRLKQGMRLQTDPTVIYAITNGTMAMDEPLTRADLTVEHPLNTYRNGGLPPHPICHPGRESLKAVLNPVETDNLYFVSNGNGGHWFSATLEEHNANVARYREMNRGTED